jgi:hypothetical protein
LLTFKIAADIFASGDSSDKVATEWYHKYQADDAAAVTDLVNCILLAAGCDQQVTQDDIRDPENCSNRLADLQNVYAEVRERRDSAPGAARLLISTLVTGRNYGLPADFQGQDHQVVP